jgi:5-(carboxyamino)imidazole ribonucleotide synthase
MLNLLGDIWERGEPDWQVVFNEPQARLHLYDKYAARHGRKMGHINCLADDVDTASGIAESLRAALTP